MNDNHKLNNTNGLNTDNIEVDIDELDKEIARSVEKMIDEETSVAKAFVDREEVMQKKTRNSASRSMDEDVLGKTQVILPIKQASQNGAASRYKADSRNTADSADKITSRSASVNRKEKDKLLVVTVMGIVLISVAVLITISLIINNGRKNSYDYNYSTGLNHYNNKSYSEAVTYWEKAVKDSEGRKNMELWIKLHECYAMLGDSQNAESTLKDALSYDKYNESVLTTLASYYIQRKDGDSLTSLLRKYKSTDGEKYLKSYIIDMPAASHPSGKYNDFVELELKTSATYKIYYTVDGSPVTTRSNEYKEPIKLQKGTTTVKAVAVDSIGTMSYELELTYDVDYRNPDAPSITPVTGTYQAGTKIEITNIPENSKAYYTLDGKNPDSTSKEYTQPIDMPQGNTVFSAIIINEHGLESAVSKRNYNVGVTTKYSFDEALERLKVVMIARDDMNKDGTAADGGQAKFTYYKKTSIANVEMYVTFYDIVKNGVTTRQSYYFGIDTSTGKCYKVFDQGGTLIATEY